MPVVSKTDRILQDVLDRITPTAQEQKRTQEMVSRVTGATEKAIKGKGLDYVIAGSFTRDTWMKDKKEFDIFIRFPVGMSREKLEEQGLELGKQISGLLRGKATVAYAEHPYTRVRLREYDVDIVPCYRVPSAMRIKSAVDRTPFHNEWLSHHFLKGLAPEVRLLKQFCKSRGVYGSDTKTQGFSGYLCELLIVQYRTFRDLASQARNWRAGKTLINLEGVYPISDIRNIHKKFPSQPLIVIDPVDPGRNVAAALSPENFIRFVKACREFCQKPSTGFFERKPPGPNIAQVERDISRKRTTLLGFRCPAPQVIEDVLWPQLRRTARRVRDILEEAEFSVFGHDVWSDGKSCVFIYELSVSELPSVRKLRGPSIFVDSHSSNFLKKYASGARVWVEGEFWTAEVKRSHREASKLLEASLSGPESGLRASGMASHLAGQIAKKREILKKSDILALARKDKAFGQFLQDHLEKHLA